VGRKVWVEVSASQLKSVFAQRTAGNMLLIVLQVNDRAEGTSGLELGVESANYLSWVPVVHYDRAASVPELAWFFQHLGETCHLVRIGLETVATARELGEGD
jgi:hypothetical protein